MQRIAAVPEGSERAAGPVARWAARLAVALAATVTTAAVADLALRAAMPAGLYYRPDDMFLNRWPPLPEIARYAPNAVFEGETYGDLAAFTGDPALREVRHVVFRTDEHGFRNSPDAAPGTPYDVLVLGDSFGAGTGTTQEQIFARLLETRFGHRVYNLSAPGSPWQSYVALRSEMHRLPLRRDAVILLTVFAGNDLTEHYYDPGVAFEDLPWSSRFDRLAVSATTFYKRSPLRLLITRLRHDGAAPGLVAVRDFVDGGKLLFFAPALGLHRQSQAAVQSHPNYLRLRGVVLEIQRLAAAHGATLAVAFLPTKEEAYGWVVDGGPRWSTPAHASAFAALLGEFCRAEGVRFADLTPALAEASRRAFDEGGKLLWWRDDSHWNGVGHAVVAEELQRRLLVGAGAR